MNIYGTTELTYQIELLMKEDSSFLIFVSPYLKLTKRLKAKMHSAFEDITQVIFLYRENELKGAEYEWLSTHSNVKLIAIENLHAKIYLNERRCLLTSMNLYEYSQINNHEIGIELFAEENPKEFLKVLLEIKLILSAQNSDFDFTQILNQFVDFSVGLLFYDIMIRFDLYGNGKNSEYYVNFCNWARETVHFELDELYQDQTAILRSTNLGRKRYDILKKEIQRSMITKEK